MFSGNVPDPCATNLVVAAADEFGAERVAAVPAVSDSDAGLESVVVEKLKSGFEDWYIPNGLPANMSWQVRALLVDGMRYCRVQGFTTGP